MSGVPVLIALGSNVGDSIFTLHSAIEKLRENINIQKVSTFVQSAPMYELNQPPFVNAALKGETDLGPLALLAFLKQTEHQLGRQERQPNGPRELDLDILAYGSLKLRTDNLQIPHPRLAERRFVLQPLVEIAPDAVLPGLPSVLEMLAATEDQAASVQPLSHAALSIPSTG